MNRLTVLLFAWLLTTTAALESGSQDLSRSASVVSHANTGAITLSSALDRGYAAVTPSRNDEAFRFAQFSSSITAPFALARRNDSSTTNGSSSVTTDLDSSLKDIKSQFNRVVEMLKDDVAKGSSNGSVNAANSSSNGSVDAANGSSDDGVFVDSETELNSYLSKELNESGMALAGAPVLISRLKDPVPTYCGVFTNTSGSYGQSLPRCFIEDAIDNFCNVSALVNVTGSAPNQTDTKGGRWITYHFSNSTNATLYVGLEIDRTHERCKNHIRIIQPEDHQVDMHCKDRLMGEIVDRCEPFT